MSIYVNFDHLIDYLREARKNRIVNISPYMDNALLNVQQMLELDVYNPILFDYVEIGNCDGCAWKGLRHQRCSCCRRNRLLKDGYTKKEEDCINANLDVLTATLRDGVESVKTTIRKGRKNDAT